MSDQDREVNGVGLGTALGGLGAAAGIFAGESSPVANLEKLKEAKDLIAQGMDPEEVWKATGWFEGRDRNWKFEIPEAGATFRFPLAGEGDPGFDQPMQATSAGRVKHFVDFPQAFEAFPGMADIRMTQRPLPTGMHGMLSKMGVAVSKDRSPLEAAETTAHELEHVAQEVSGHGLGGTTESVEHMFPEVTAERGAFRAYQDLAGEQDAELVANRLKRALGGEDVYSEFPMKGYTTPPSEQLLHLKAPVPIEKYLQGLSAPQTVFPDSPPITGHAEMRVPPLREGSTALKLMSLLKRALR